MRKYDVDVGKAFMWWMGYGAALIRVAARLDVDLFYMITLAGTVALPQMIVF